MQRILAAYITRNAEGFFDASLKSVKDHVDGIVVIDDNSIDNTREIAREYGAEVITGEFHRDKRPQRQAYLDYADRHGYDWILQVDDDEVYTEECLKNLVELINKDDTTVAIRYEFINFWKVPYQRITGHHWGQRLERCFKNLGGMRYDVHHMVSDRNGRKVNGDSYYVHRIVYPHPSDICVHHYSHCKPIEKIRDKIKYYMLRDNPNVTEGNVDEWVNKHPFFSGDFEGQRYGEHGLYIAGSVGNQKDKVVDYGGNHPKAVFKSDMFYHNYNIGAEKYMVGHWQFHNHLDHDRHQNRIRKAAHLCKGRTLEVGAANGFSTMTMQEENPEADFEGYEVTAWGHQQAKVNYPKKNWHRGNGENMKFEDGAYDTVIIPEIIEHVAYPRALADEAWRVCSSRMIVTTPTKVHPDPDHKRFFSVDDMEEFLQPYGKPWFVGLKEDGSVAERVDDIYFQMAVVDKNV